MLIIGANLGATSYGKRLPDGSLSVLRDEKVEFAAAEERFSRTKCDGGFDLAFEAYLKRWKRKRSDIELFVFSSCCDELGRAPIPGGVAVERVVFCSHHLSHALGSFVWSNFDEAIAIVIDSGGDNLEPLKAGQWWRSAREQHSFFHLTQKKHRLIGRHADGRGEAGFGELFRAFTYYLGWHGARYAGNTMALSGFGDSDALQRLHLFDIDNERFASHIDNDPNRPIEIVQTFLERSNLSGFKPRPARGPFERYHFDLASLIQRELERYLETVIRNLVRSTGVSNVILSGGVAYNCLAVGRLREKLQNIELFVQPASGDIGQGFGNACYGFFLTDGRTPFFEERKSDLGMRYRKRRYDPAKMVGGAFVTATADSELAVLTRKLMEGHITAIYFGRGEYGPRALGHRSIVALATLKSNKRRLNRLKTRGYFMPIAPVVTDDTADRFFHCPRPMPWMTEVVKLRKEYQEVLSAGSHAKGWCRIQTVAESDSSLFYKILKTIEKTGEIPVLLNTSLNGPGEPIVETPRQAFEFFIRNSLSSAWIDGIMYEKASGGNDAAGNLISDFSTYSESFLDGPADLVGLRERLSFVFPDLCLHLRTRFSLSSEFIAWMEQGRKSTTIRYKCGAVESPESIELTLYKTEKYEALDEEVAPAVGLAKIHRVTYKAFGDLDRGDAQRDGFLSLPQLIAVLKEIYGNVQNDEIVTIYEIDFQRFA